MNSTKLPAFSIASDMAASFVYHCNSCGKEFYQPGIVYLCPECGKSEFPGQPPAGILSLHYDPSDFKHLGFNELKKQHFLPLLPISKISSFSNLGVGDTPLIEVNRPHSTDFPFQLWIKDDSRQPTWSLKDRASALVSAFATENNITTLVAASTGNAGSSLAGICASAGQKAIIFAPAAAPPAKLTQILMYGAQLIPVDGNYDQAFDLSVQISERKGWYNRNTAFNPLTIEGKKTVSFEIFDQMGQGVPDKIFVAVGDGVIIAGLYKGFIDLLQAGIISNLPEIIAVQAEGSAAFHVNLLEKTFTPVQAKTVADSISVNIPRNFVMTQKIMLKHGGSTCVVSDTDILQASFSLSRKTGVFAEPAAAAAWAGMMQFYQNNKISRNENVVVLITGSGLKDIPSVQPLLKIPSAVPPEIDEVCQRLENMTSE